MVSQGMCSCHFVLLIVIRVTLDVLGRGWHSQWQPVEIISPLWALWTWPLFKQGSDDSLFWWRTAQTSFESGLHFTGRSQKLCSNCCLKGADTESLRQVRSTSVSVTWTCTDQVAPERASVMMNSSGCGSCSLGATTNLRSHSITARAAELCN